MKNPLEVQAQKGGKTAWHRFHDWSGGIVFLWLLLSLSPIMLAKRIADTLVQYNLEYLQNWAVAAYIVFWIVLFVIMYIVAGKVLDLNNAFVVPLPGARHGLRYFKRSDGHLTELEPGTYDLRITRVLAVPGELELVAHEFDLDPECPLARCDFVSWKLKFNFADSDTVDLEWFVAVFEIANSMGLYYDMLMVDPFLETFDGTKMLASCEREREDSEEDTVAT
ncbi:MAG: hypothetical protein NT003_03845 [Candidatus Magasanikbacteria bacterium]|nr:hypothetical protein [Candidatus Magasanikbacteria bacterium]